MKKKLLLLLGVVTLSSTNLFPIAALADENTTFSNSTTVEYVQTDAGLFSITTDTDNGKIVSTNLNTGKSSTVIKTSADRTDMYYSNGEHHYYEKVGNQILFDGDTVVATLEVDRMKSMQRASSPWGNGYKYVYSYKCSSNYDRYGRDIVSNIVGFVPVLGPVSGAVGLIRAVVGSSSSKKVYFSVDDYRTNDYRNMRARVFVYANSNYTGYKGYTDGGNTPVV